MLMKLTPFVRIDGNAEKARVCVNELIFVAYHRIPKDTCVIEISQTSHIFAAVKFWWINLTNLIFFEDFRLKKLFKMSSIFN
jgi:hypothetical protein